MSRNLRQSLLPFVGKPSLSSTSACILVNNESVPSVSASLSVEENHSSSCPLDLGVDKPSQPILTCYPFSKDGTQQRAFNKAWYASRKWLEYSPISDRAYCYPCRIFLIHEQLKDRTFCDNGYCNWKKATDRKQGFARNESCESHLAAMKRWNERDQREEKNLKISTQLCEQQVHRNRYYMTAIFETIQFLVMNEMPLRGDKETAAEIIDEKDYLCGGKFIALFEFAAKRDDQLKAAILTIPENAKYKSPQMQNEIITVMSNIVQRRIVEEINTSDGKCFSIKCDGMTDKDNIEHLSIVIRYVKDCKPCERLIDLVQLERRDAMYIATTIIDRLKEIGLNLNELLSQSYDGANVMAGYKGGVQKFIQDLLGKEVPFVHCFNHQLHLVVVYAFESDPSIKQFFETCDALYKFTRRPVISAEYNGEKLKRLLCMRWTGHLATVKTIIKSYNDILELLDSCSRSVRLSAELVAMAIGFSDIVREIKFRTTAHFVVEILNTLQPANALLQAEKMDLMQGMELVKHAEKEIQNLRCDEAFKRIWKESQMNDENDEIASRELRPKRFKPNRLFTDYVLTETTGQRMSSSIVDIANGEFDSKKLFYQLIDSVLEEMSKRFNERSLQLMAALYSLTPTSSDFLNFNAVEPLITLLSLSETETEQLESEMKVAKPYIRGKIAFPNSFDAISTVIGIIYPVKDGFPLLYRLLCTALTFGASTAVCENSFSALSRISTSFRRSMLQSRLRNLVFLSFEKDFTSQIKKEEFLSAFYKQSRRLQV